MNNKNIKHKNFISQESPYKISVRKGIGNENWMDFSAVIFEISLDNKRYNGDYFFSILQWAQERFSEITIIICDTLQRYNIMYDQKVTEEEAFLLSRNLGKQWLCQNKSILDALKISPHIFYWDNWLLHKNDLNNNQNTLNTLYANNVYFRNECDKIFENIWERFKKKYTNNIIVKADIINNLIKPYFFEETAITDIFLSRINGISAYPGSLHQVWDDFSSGKIDGLNGFKGRTFLSLNLIKNHTTLQSI
jgi:tRNA-dependent cyclodipeptide synthase